MFSPGRDGGNSFIGSWQWLGKSSEPLAEEGDDLLRVVGNEVDSHRKKLRRRKQAGLILLIPFLILTSYFYIIGRDRYFVRSDVVVRRSNDVGQVPLNGLGALLSQGNQLSLEDARFLRIYLESPQVLQDLKKQINFNDINKQKGLDIFSGLPKNPSKEKAYTFFRKQISTTLDEASGVLRIRTLGFSPQASKLLNSFLIQKAETFVNEMNQDVYKEQLAFAQGQVIENADKYQQAAVELATYQQNQKIISAEQEAASSAKVISILETKLAEKKVQLATARITFVDDKAPEIRALKSAIKSIEDQILLERQTLVIADGKNIPAQANNLQRLKAKLKFNGELYKSSLALAEKLRVDSLQQQRFLAVITQPMLPQTPWNYWRHKGFLTAIAILFVCYCLVNFVLRMADSHRN